MSKRIPPKLAYKAFTSAPVHSAKRACYFHKACPLILQKKNAPANLPSVPANSASVPANSVSVSANCLHVPDNYESVPAK